MPRERIHTSHLPPFDPTETSDWANEPLPPPLSLLEAADCFDDFAAMRDKGFGNVEKARELIPAWESLEYHSDLLEARGDYESVVRLGHVGESLFEVDDPENDPSYPNELRKVGAMIRQFAALFPSEQSAIPVTAPVKQAANAVQAPAVKTEERIARALVILKDNPNLSDRKIASMVGTSASTLSRSRLWRQARKMQAGSIPDGQRYDDGTIEAGAD